MASMSDTPTMPLEDIKKNLFKAVMSAEWKEVVNMYEKHPETHAAKITKSGDTALHIAISDGQDRTVEQLIQRGKKALEAENELGNTPLHLAASLGNVKMCTWICNTASKSNFSKLISGRNHDSETPLFVAARHGRKDAFLCLHEFCLREKVDSSSFCLGKDGETILHCAIAGEYFDLAFQIIHLYKDLVNRVNEQGFSPLHVLASKPTAFKTGSNIRGYSKIIYHFMIVDKLEPQTHCHQPLFHELEYDENAKYPENYQTCVNLGWLTGKVVRFLVLGRGKDDGGHSSDVEDPNRRHKKKASQQGRLRAQGYDAFPSIYDTCFDAIKFMYKAMLIIFGIGSNEIVRLQAKRQKHQWSVQVLDELLNCSSMYEYDDNGRNPRKWSPHNDDGTKPYSIVDGAVGFFHTVASSPQEDSGEKKQITEMGKTENTILIAAKNGVEMVSEILKHFPVAIRDMNSVKKSVVLSAVENKQITEMGKGETPILIAAKNGVVEMVSKILKHFPVAIHDMNSDKKNVVLLAVENRQPHVYNFLRKMKIVKESIFRKVDKDGNSALHLAARLGENRPWLIPGDALQMQWEIKWYEYVKKSMPLQFFVRVNKNEQTPKDLFTATHKDLVLSAGQWLTNTSQSCSVVAALIATVAFATSTTVPGGIKQENGAPLLEDQPAFDIFAIAALVALCFSVTSLVMFLAILTSRYQEKDFGTSLPRKLLLGLTSLFVSIAAILISFCSGHFFVLKHKLKFAALPIYLITCLPVTLFATAQFPLYFDLIRATFEEVPQRSYKAVPLSI